MRVAASADAGFTVLEALVALVVLSGTTAAVLSIVSAHASAQARQEAALTDAVQAQALLNRIGLDIPARPGSVTGTGHDGRSWSIEIRPYADGPETEGPRAVLLLDLRIRVPAEAGGTELRTLVRGRP